MSQAHHHDAPKDSYVLPESTWTKGRNVLLALMLISWAAALAGWAGNHERFFESYLVAFWFSVSVALGATLFIMIQHLTGAAWSVPIRRMMENVMMSFPVLAVLVIPVVLGSHHLYEHWILPENVKGDPILESKQAYLNETAFYIRIVIFFAIWCFWAWRLYSWSKAQDASKDVSYTFKAERLSAPGVLLFFLSGSLAAVDFVMSLNPHWFSTIFGVYNLAGGSWCMWALVCFTFLRFRANGIMSNSVTTEHYHDMGKWMFALTVFWAYIAFSQYMLIWYANLPEETIFFKVRRTGSWESISGVLLFGHFILTFVVLLARFAKRNLNTLRFITIWIPIMHYVDCYWMIMPNFYGAGFTPHWLDAACFFAVFSTLATAFWWRLQGANIAPVGDPRFQKGMEFINV